MIAFRLAARAFTLLAMAALALAVGWWWRTFGEVVGYGYLSWGEAGRCLLAENDVCSLAKALCLGSHPRNFVAYWSVAFWIAAALVSLACFVGPGEPRPPRA